MRNFSSSLKSFVQFSLKNFRSKFNSIKESETEGMLKFEAIHWVFSKEILKQIQIDKKSKKKSKFKAISDFFRINLLVDGKLFLLVSSHFWSHSQIILFSHFFLIHLMNFPWKTLFWLKLFLLTQNMIS